MASIVDCPSCNRKLHIPEELMTGKVQCPTCGSTFSARNGAEPASAWQQPAPIPASGYRRPRPDEYDDEDLPRSRRRRDLPAHRGPLILVLGILSVLPHGLHLILGPIAWILGNSDLKAMRAGRMDPEGEGMTNAGRICGIIGTILGLVALLFIGLFVCIWFGLMAALLSAASSQHPTRRVTPPPVQRRPGMIVPLQPQAWLPDAKTRRTARAAEGLS